ncbi:MAG: amino acid permease [Bifidobacteriaceae bacterium]|jgi:D-serine/D-alanine/glycine transporter|nr:amino acid permease [Bifidobacteriaceae bacterium]
MNKNITNSNLHRGLTNRHLQLLAIGGTISTGLFLGVGQTIIEAGPSTILAYLLAGVICFFSMRVLGEMLLSNLKFRTFRDIASAYLGHWSGFLIGCIYWFVWISVSILDSLAAAIYLKDYIPGVPLWIPSLAIIIIIFLVNVGGVKNFGEAEFWLALIKIIAIIMLIVVGIYLLITGYTYQFSFGESSSSFTETLSANIGNLWRFGGFFPNGFVGFGAGFQMAFFAYGGIESIASTSAETKNQEKTMPRAINSIPVRILLFYVLAVFVILCCVPWNRITMLQGSPFANIFNAVGLPGVGIFMIVVLLSAATSGANAGIYVSSRMIYGLASDGQIPKIFAKLNRFQAPFVALVFCSLTAGAIVTLGAILFSDPMNAFIFFASMATVGISSVWILVLLTYFIYRKKYPVLHKNSEFKAPAGIVISSLSIAVFIIMYILMFFSSDTRLAIFVTLIVTAIISIIYKMKIKNKENINF